eukprot:TRINITY_DN61_c3_g1_i1.p1 TRINITY_DN61_c3_g1~~TRINITY_DN61_c3_g1_i1.p1  ORF type:complete len:338 (-),score=86.55 TRINITY_DN61_c3_g1_i1:102-1115(-)
MSKVVCVTGASGYIATEVIRQLIKDGFTIRGTVRNLNDQQKVSHLKELFPSLKLYESDLLKDGSFDEAVKGCDVVLHTASPFQLKVEDPTRDLIEPAVNGTKNVLSAVAKSKDTVKLVVVTSSVASITTELEPPADKIYDENDWNTTSTLQTNPYRLSKTLAERYVWEWADQNKDVRVCTILPSLVIGPPMSKRTDSTSIKIVKEMLDGTAKKNGGVPAVALSWIDVRDVAYAHIACISNENANGRYLVSSVEGVARIEFAKILKNKYPNAQIPDTQVGELKRTIRVSRDKTSKTLPPSSTSSSRDIFQNSNSLEKSLIEMAESLIELGIVPKELVL